MFRVFLFKPLSFLTGRDYEWYGLNYFTDFFSYGPVHSVNYLKYPHMLDCHSAFHLLPEIKAPTLVVSGMLDVLTPSYHSYEMASRMPNCELLVKTWGTHFVLLEYPEEVGTRIEEFLRTNGRLDWATTKEKGSRHGKRGRSGSRARDRGRSRGRGAK